MSAQHANTATARRVVLDDTVFEAPLEMLLASAPVTTRAGKSRRRS
jgi:hypothetical protein